MRAARERDLYIERLISITWGPERSPPSVMRQATKSVTPIGRIGWASNVRIQLRVGVPRHRVQRLRAARRDHCLAPRKQIASAHSARLLWRHVHERLASMDVFKPDTADSRNYTAAGPNAMAPVLRILHVANFQSRPCIAFLELLLLYTLALLCSALDMSPEKLMLLSYFVLNCPRL